MEIEEGIKGWSYQVCVIQRENVPVFLSNLFVPDSNQELTIKRLIITYKRSCCQVYQYLLLPNVCLNICNKEYDCIWRPVFIFVLKRRFEAIYLCNFCIIKWSYDTHQDFTWIISWWCIICHAFFMKCSVWFNKLNWLWQHQESQISPVCWVQFIFTLWDCKI